jgi:monoamine oxidase
MPSTAGFLFVSLNLHHLFMKGCDILIIGAGATGLMAARTLAKSGKKVTILEARDRCGGRIHTLNNKHFTELGAEFVHGDLPVTLNLLKETGIKYHHSGGEMWHYRDGKFDSEGGIVDDWHLLAAKLKKVKKDVSINMFLENEFPGEKFDGLKKSVRRFASGYDTADPDQASTFALRDEWLTGDEEHTYRVNGGYGKMIAFLEEDCRNAGGTIILNSVAKEVHWQPGSVKVITEDETIYQAEKLIIALPLGVLQADKNEMAAITFIPPIPQQTEAINKMGFGAIIKILLEFDTPFWEDAQTKALTGKSPETMAFLLSDEEIPTWWTQLPQHSPVLTGWLGGPAASKKKNEPDSRLLQESLQSLSDIFKRSVEELKDKLVSSHIVNWTNDPFTLGSYAYDTIETASARKILNEPVEDTVFFAGEYLYKGTMMGTVEAALVSGVEVAEKNSLMDS